MGQIGVDVSQEHLDIYDPRSGDRRMPNDPAAIRGWIAPIAPDSFLVFEATSRYDKTLQAEARAACLPFARINPLHGWHFAHSLNLPKTDRTDARMLARFGAERHPAETPAMDPAWVTLAALSQRRDQLRRMETQEKNRLGETTIPVLRRDLQASLRVLAGRVSWIEALIRAHLQAHPHLAGQALLLRSIPGIGPVAAVELLAHLPQLGLLDRRAIASLAGSAPRARESGKFKGKRSLGPGRRHIRRCLYLAALSAIRHPHLLGGAASRLRDAVKPGKVIAIALARKILTIANAVLRDAKPYHSA